MSAEKYDRIAAIVNETRDSHRTRLQRKTLAAVVAIVDEPETEESAEKSENAEPARRGPGRPRKV